MRKRVFKGNSVRNFSVERNVMQTSFSPTVNLTNLTQLAIKLSRYLPNSPLNKGIINCLPARHSYKLFLFSKHFSVQFANNEGEPKPQISLRC